jgi:hypothetical protein
MILRNIPSALLANHIFDIGFAETTQRNRSSGGFFFFHLLFKNFLLFSLGPFCGLAPFLSFVHFADY